MDLLCFGRENQDGLVTQGGEKTKMDLVGSARGLGS